MTILRLSSARRIVLNLTALGLFLFAPTLLTAASPLRIAISPDIPPYVMQRAQGGLEVDLIKASFPDHELQFVQMPYADLQTAIGKHRADVSVGVRATDDDVFYSENYLTFVNVAVSKNAAGLELNSIADLKNYRVLTWQNAYRELGDEFETLFGPQSPQRKNYVEVADQTKQVEMFWSADDAVIVIDRNIFSHISKDLGHSLDDVTLHFLFPPTTEFKVGFANAELRDQFNRRLGDLCESGEYAKLLRKYDVQLPYSICDQLAVERATRQFYAALNAMFTGELGPMKAIWSHADDVTYLPPDGTLRTGWKQVLADWQKQADMKLGGKVTPQDLHIVIGHDLAVTHNYEIGENTVDGRPQRVKIRATNVFRKEHGEWKMIGHHTDKLPFLEQ